ncbi:MAG: DUF4417 domain-containing protein [Elusimicrobia bacterium]|nr:DUF4417 domain-containing protein [Elusimicrobiota bacterium]
MLKLNLRKYDIFKLYYWHNATLVGKYKLPKLEPTQEIPSNVISFNERKRILKPEEYWVDFFIDDALFENFWNHPEISFLNLKNFKGIITPDYSMLPEMLPAQKIWNCTRNRIMAYYLQQQGFNIIPVASWCEKEDFEWCFDGLPEKSSIAISSNGCKSSPYGYKMFLKGVEELQKQKVPTNLIVCGGHIPDLDVYDNMKYYPSFSQRMKRRIKNG